jgi:RND family efflux transporter MFP subunit
MTDLATPASLVRGCLLLGLSLAAAGCSADAPEGGPMPPPAVTVSAPLERTVADFNTFSGRTAAVETVEVRARVWGHLDRVNFKEGAFVHKDDVLFEIDSKTYEAAVNQAKAKVALDETQLRYYESDFSRTQSLRRTGAASQDDLEKAQAARDVAGATIAADRADLTQKQLDLDFTKVKAPISGRISRTLVTPGNMIQSGQNGGTLLTTIVTVDPMYAYFDVDDLTFLKIKGQLQAEPADSASAPPRPQVFLRLVNETGFPHKGEIDFVNNQVDPATGTMKVRGAFPNKDGALTPGLFVQVRVPAGDAHRALLVTERAVDTDQGEKVLYVVNKENVVEKRSVRLGRLHDGLREIESGLTAGEHVVVDGIQRVRGGVTVEPKLVEMPVPPDANPR